MIAERKRVFVGNLPPDITQQDIEKKFSSFGTVMSVEIKHRADNSTFAFLDFKARETELNSCFELLRKKKWNGYRIKLELAKEHFLNKLKQEIEINKIENSNETIQCLSDANKVSRKRKAEESIHETKTKKRKVKQSHDKGSAESSSDSEDESNCKLKKRKVKQNHDRSSSESSSDSKDESNTKLKKRKVEQNSDKSSSKSSSDSEDESNRKIKKFEGTKKYLSSISLEKEENNRNLSDKSINKHTNNADANDLLERLESFSSVWKDSEDEYPKRSLKAKKEILHANSIKREPTRRAHDNVDKEVIKTDLPKYTERMNNSYDLNSKNLLAEEKRIKSLEEKRKSLQKQKEIIKNALIAVDADKRNKKIVFDSDEDNENGLKTPHSKPESISNEFKVQKVKKPSLFEDSSNEDESDDDNFKIKSQFEGIKGQKLLELQTRYATDKRFILDQRFYESGDEDAEEGIASGENVTTDNEKERQLKILQNILGHQIPISQKSKKKASQISMLRFDPTKPDHAKFEKKTEIKKKHKLPDVLPEDSKVVNKKEENLTQDNHQVSVSKEKFYKISDSFKTSILQKEEQSQFSLRKLFGNKTEDSENEDNTETYHAQVLKKGKKIGWTSNPFKYDSSDSEGGEDKEESKTGSQHSTGDSNLQSNQTHFHENFFFKPNDPRLQEGLDFFKRCESADTSVENFAKHRRELKHIVRCKVKNNVRNHRPFRKKIGGNKSRKFRRKM